MNNCLKIFCIAGVLLPCILNAGSPTEQCYRIEMLMPPAECVLEVGGMGWSPDGKLMLCTRRGEIWSVKDGKWQRFASGLQEALGLQCGAAGEVFVLQRSELTRVKDNDGDGEADLFETVSDAWGFSGNYHEYAFGLVRDKEGNFFGTLGLAFAKDSFGGTWLGCLPNTPHRGWSFRVTPKGEFTPWSSGLRAPNGIGMDPNGEIFYSDNQGSFNACGSLNHLSKDAFHGHPSGLIWDSQQRIVKSDPTKMSNEELEKLRKRPAIFYIHGKFGQSQSEPHWDTTGGKFGPFSGQCFVGDVIRPMVFRCVLEKVDGEFQGACIPFLFDPNLGGANRLLFAQDGSLYVGCTDRGWGKGHSGLKRIVWSGETPMDIQNVSLTKTGFRVTFTKPLNEKAAADASNYSVLHYGYQWSKQYGGPQKDITPAQVAKVEVSADKTSVLLTLSALLPEKVYEINFKNFSAADDTPLKNAAAFYTLNRLKKD